MTFFQPQRQNTHTSVKLSNFIIDIWMPVWHEKKNGRRIYNEVQIWSSERKTSLESDSGSLKRVHSHKHEDAAVFTVEVPGKITERTWLHISAIIILATLRITGPEIPRLLHHDWKQLKPSSDVAQLMDQILAATQQCNSKRPEVNGQQP